MGRLLRLADIKRNVCGAFLIRNASPCLPSDGAVLKPCRVVWRDLIFSVMVGGMGVDFFVCVRGGLFVDGLK